MKKIIFLALLSIITLSTFAQTWYGSNPTFNDGFVGSVSFTGAATIKGHVTFTNGGGFANIAVMPGATLTLTENTSFNGGYLIEDGGKIEALKDLTLTTGGSWYMSIMNATLQVAGTLEITGSHIRFLSPCAVITTKNFSYHTDNIIDASSGATGGLLYVAGDYLNEYQNNYYTGHPLTTLSSVYINTTNTTGNIGSAQRSNLTSSVCSTVTPVLIVDETIVSNSNKQVTATWTTTSETNNDHFVIEGSKDGKIWTDVATVNSYYSTGTSSSSHVYSVTFDNGIMVAEAGIGFGLLGFLFTGKGVKRRKSIGIVLVLATVFLFSCAKSVVTIKNLQSNYTQFRLKQIDKDGTISYVPKIFKIS